MKWLVLAVLTIITIIFPPNIFALEFNISNPTISSNELSFDASSSAQSRAYYLQGAIRKIDNAYYFGSTKNLDGNWIDYISSPDPVYIASNFYLASPIDSSWSGKLSMKFSSSDVNYKGPGDYELKVRLFTGASSSATSTSSNVLTITLNEPLPSPLVELSPSPSPSPSYSPQPIDEILAENRTPPSPESRPTKPPRPSPSPELETLEGTVAGTSDIDLSIFQESSLSPSQSSLIKSSNALTLNKDRLKIVLMIGAGLIISSVAGFFGYRKYLSKRKIRS